MSMADSDFSPLDEFTVSDSTVKIMAKHAKTPAPGSDALRPEGAADAALSDDAPAPAPPTRKELLTRLRQIRNLKRSARCPQQRHPDSTADDVRQLHRLSANLDMLLAQAGIPNDPHVKQYLRDSIAAGTVRNPDDLISQLTKKVGSNKVILSTQAKAAVSRACSE